MVESISGAPKSSHIQLCDIELNRIPFLYFVAEHVFDYGLANDLLAWLQESATWQLRSASFYEQYECDLLETHLPESCRPVTDEASLRTLRQRVSELFEVDLTDRLTITAHKLVRGQGIGIHNDVPHDGLETHRFVVHLGQGFEDRMGGHLVFFNTRDQSDVNRIFRPLHNSGVGFAMSERSYHAVSDVRYGARYSVIFSFWRKDQRRSLEVEREVPSELIGFLRKIKAGEVRHSGSTLLAHLTETHRILKRWGAGTAVCVAGLFHSVYGTEDFRTAIISAEARGRLRDLIGEEAERLAYLFATTSRRSLYESIGRRPPFSLLCIDREVVKVGEREQVSLLLIDLANSLEQLPRVDIPPDVLADEWALYERAAPLLPQIAVQEMRSSYETQVKRAKRCCNRS